MASHLYYSIKRNKIKQVPPNAWPNPRAQRITLRNPSPRYSPITRNKSNPYYKPQKHARFNSLWAIP